jgi:AcrR family transcriptional regulator
MEPTQHPRFDAAHRDPLTRERIIEAALRIIDGQGLSRLTMRRLGDSLEVEAMAIYHHLPRGKEELLDGIVAYVGIHPADTRRVTPENYRARLSDWARAYRTLLLRHAGTLPLLVTRRNPAALATTTASLREVLRQAGFREGAAAVAAHTLLSHLLGHAALEARGRSLAETGEPESAAVDWDARFAQSLDLLLSALTPS